MAHLVPMRHDRSDRLAVDGSTPLRTHPFPAWPAPSEADIDAATAVLRSGKLNYWTGEEGHSFEREYAAYVGTRHAVAVANGSVALELALLALRIGPGDEVVVTSRSFIASASSVAVRGAVPVFADVDRDSQNVSADTIARVLTPSTKAVIVVHLAGWPCDMDSIMVLARENNLKLIEDCAQAHGAQYKGRPVGSFGDINAFSFCQDKIVTTGGEGGLVTTDDSTLWERAWSYKDHGKSYDAVYRRAHPPGYRFLHESIGTNWRMTEMQAAIGRAQLRTLDQQVAQRRQNAAIFSAAFARCQALRVTLPPPEATHSYYRYHFFVRPDCLKAGWNRDRILAAIVAEGIPCLSGYREMFLEKAFPPAWKPSSRMENVRELAETGLVLPVHPTLSATDLDDIIAAVEKVMAVASI